MHKLLTACLATLALAGCVADDPTAPGDGPKMFYKEAGDIVVLAIVDSAFNPYHWDFSAEHMPQHLDDDPENDLPLDLPPHEWLPLFPDPEEAFASYAPLHLNLTPEDGDAVPSCVQTADGRMDPVVDLVFGPGPECPEEGGLYQQDADAWATVQQSTPESIHYQYIPGTKIIGYLNWGSGTGFSPSSHGVGTTSVSVGNIHGSCPECLLVFVNGFDDDVNAWFANQGWIDVQTNSWGASTGYRENIWVGCDIPTLTAGSERGQQIFWSGGNGQANAFVAPVNTLNSCQKGPDYLVTVGAISPDNDGSYTGHGKPVDVASYGSDYPSAGGATVTANSTFGGTSNASPVTGGMYAKSLYTLRKEMPGPSRMQDNGTIATGPAGCGDANPDCALADGIVTVHELRHAFLRAAEFTAAYFTTGTLGATEDVALPGTTETEYYTEGHGSFRAHLGDLDAELARIQDEIHGRAYDAPSEEHEAFLTAVSYCAQQIWGTWDHGYWADGDDLPEDDPTNWPLRSWLTGPCPDANGVLISAGSG